jgi:anti-anti-sigma factor
MVINTAKQDGRSIVCASGEIDLSNTEELKAAVDKAIQETPTGIVMDLRKTTYIDSAGIQTILHAYKLLQEGGGQLTVIACREVHNLLNLLALERLPGICIEDGPEPAASQTI